MPPITINLGNYALNADNTRDFNYPLGNKPSSLDFPLLAVIPGAGRFSFYIDYSELDGVGTHTFFVVRTHGSMGAVSVDYQTDGDSHSAVSGTLSWAHGDMGIKAFTATVSASNLSSHQASGLGEHRIHAKLTNPTGGAVVHEKEYNVAYGVIDDGTIASDSHAVFVNADAISNGVGTFASPYNNIYDGVTNVGSKRYIYIKGTQTIDGTYSEPLYGNPVDCLPIPATRTSEATRLYIRNWPGSTCLVQGDGVSTDQCGFMQYDDDRSYHTYRGISFDNIDNSSVDNVASIGYFYGNCEFINVEHCQSTNLNGRIGANHASYALYRIAGGKIWRSTSDNVMLEGDNTNGNTAGAETYQAHSISIQRCEFSRCGNAAFQKIGPADENDNSVDYPPYSLRFNIFSECTNGAEYAGNEGRPVQNYVLIQQNLFLGCLARVWPRDWTPAGEAQSPWLAGNVFYQSGSGDQGAIYTGNNDNIMAFNNIFYQCRREFLDYQGPKDDETGVQHTRDPLIKLYDFNCGYGTTLTSLEFRLWGVNLSRAQWQAEGYSANDITDNPQFTDAANGDFSLQAGSPCLGSGLGGSNMGLYLTGIEAIGA